MSSIEDKKINVTRFAVIGAWTPEDHQSALEKMKLHLAAKLDDINPDEVDCGWASGKAELNRELTPEDCIVGDYIYASMRITAKKIPAGIAKALCRKKIEEYKKQNGVDFVSRKERDKIKEEVKEYLLPRVMPTVKSVWVVIVPNGTVYAGTVSNGERDMLGVLFYRTFGKEMQPLQVEDLADWAVLDRLTCKETDLEFLTDLFRQTEQNEVKTFFAVAPFDFVSEDGDAPCTRALAAGECAKDSEEVRTALRQGKMLRKINLIVTGVPGYDENDRFEFTLNKDFGISRLQTPEDEEMNFPARFAEKVQDIDAIFAWIADKAQNFIGRAASPDFYAKKDAWIAER